MFSIKRARAQQTPNIPQLLPNSHGSIKRAASSAVAKSTNANPRCMPASYSQQELHQLCEQDRSFGWGCRYKKGALHSCLSAALSGMLAVFRGLSTIKWSKATTLSKNRVRCQLSVFVYAPVSLFLTSLTDVMFGYGDSSICKSSSVDVSGIPWGCVYVACWHHGDGGNAHYCKLSGKMSAAAKLPDTS